MIFYIVKMDHNIESILSYSHLQTEVIIIADFCFSIKPSPTVNLKDGDTLRLTCVLDYGWESVVWKIAGSSGYIMTSFPDNCGTNDSVRGFYFSCNKSSVVLLSSNPSDGQVWECIQFTNKSRMSVQTRVEIITGTHYYMCLIKL